MNSIVPAPEYLIALAAVTAASVIALRIAVGHAGGRGLFDHLLVTALRRAVALVKMHGVAEIVAEDLHLDMARLLDIFFDQNGIVAEGSLGLAFRPRPMPRRTPPDRRRGACLCRHRRRSL